MIALPRRCFGTRYYLANLVLLLGLVRTESVQASTTSNKDRHLSPSPSLPFSCQLLEFDVLVEKESDSSGTLSDTKDCICLTEDDELLPIVLPEGLQLNHHCEAGTNVVFSNAQIFQQRLLVEPTSTISIDESGQDTRQLGIQFADKTNNDENIFHEASITFLLHMVGTKSMWCHWCVDNFSTSEICQQDVSCKRPISLAIASTESEGTPQSNARRPAPISRPAKRGSGAAPTAGSRPSDSPTPRRYQQLPSLAPRPARKSASLLMWTWSMS